MKTKLLFLITFLSLTIISCNKDEEEIYYDFDEKTFNTKQKQWKEQNIQNYKYDQYYMSSATGPISETIVVRNGIATSESDERSAFIGTLSDVFARIENDFNEGKSNQQLPIYGISVKIKYNENYHYLEDVTFSTSYKGDVVGGMWYDLKISNFEILEEE